LKDGFEKLTRIVIDISDRDRPDLRAAVAAPQGVQPVLVFLDLDGRPRSELALVAFERANVAAKLAAALRGLSLLR